MLSATVPLLAWHIVTEIEPREQTKAYTLRFRSLRAAWLDRSTGNPSKFKRDWSRNLLISNAPTALNACLQIWQSLKMYGTRLSSVSCHQVFRKKKYKLPSTLFAKGNMTGSLLCRAKSGRLSYLLLEEQVSLTAQGHCHNT